MKGKVVPFFVVPLIMGIGCILLGFIAGFLLPKVFYTSNNTFSHQEVYKTKISFPDPNFSLMKEEKGGGCSYSNSVVYQAPFVCVQGIMVGILQYHEYPVSVIDFISSPELRFVLLFYTENVFIPTTIYQATNMFLIKSISSLNGTLPSEIGLLSGLVTFMSTQDDVEGSIPSQFGLLSALRLLAFTDNNLSGDIPSEIFSLGSLVNLFFSSNDVTGIIPTTISMPSILAIDLRSNLCSGTIPSQIGLLSVLTSLELYSNLFSGSIPSELGKLSELVMLDFGVNYLSGPIPSELSLLTKLKTLSLDQNEFRSTVPSEFGLLTDLRLLYLGFNKLSGTLPSELGLLTSLVKFGVDSNNLEGPISFSITGFTCKNSGLDVNGCWKPCKPCEFYQLQFGDCNSSGIGRVCFTGAILFPILSFIVLIVSISIKLLTGLSGTSKAYIVGVLTATITSLDFLTDFIFLVNQEKWIQILSIVTLSLACIVRLILSSRILSNLIYFPIHLISTPVKKKIYFYYSIAFCSLSPVTIPLLVEQTSEIHLAELNRTIVTVLFLEGLPQLVIQVGTIASTGPTLLVIVSLLFTLQSLAGKLVSIFIRQFIAKGWISSAEIESMISPSILHVGRETFLDLYDSRSRFGSVVSVTS